MIIVLSIICVCLLISGISIYRKHFMDSVLDYHGTTYGLRRLLLESNSAFRRRILLSILQIGSNFTYDDNKIIGKKVTIYNRSGECVKGKWLNTADMKLENIRRI